MFKPNEGRLDRGIRIALGIVLMLVGFGGAVAGGFGILVGVVGLVALTTGVVGYCPLYAIFGFRTGPKRGAVP